MGTDFIAGRPAEPSVSLQGGGVHRALDTTDQRCCPALVKTGAGILPRTIVLPSVTAWRHSANIITCLSIVLARAECKADSSAMGQLLFFLLTS